MRPIAAVLLALVLSCCAGAKARDALRNGLLTIDQQQETFLQVWGYPDSTETMTGVDQKGATWGSGGFTFQSGKANLEVWNYESRKTHLVFYRKRLNTWHTDKTTKELASPR